MNFIAPDLVPAVPEIALLILIALVLVVDVYVPERYRVFTYQLAQASLVLTGLLVIGLFPEAPQITFSGTFILDQMAAVLKVFILLLSFIAFLYSKSYLQQRQIFKGEYYILGMTAVLGMLILVSAHSLLTLYLGLELLSLSLYALVAIHRDSIPASEAAMKYFVLGALASGMLLYGMSMLYGETATLDLGVLAEAVSASSEHNIVLILGLVFVMVGVAFKLGAVPFHMWVPDVYEGAPTPVTLFLGTAPKLAAFAMLMRLVVDGLPGLQAEWNQILMLLAVLSIGLGNVVAIAQTNLKRMFAYSTIAHVGFLFIGIIAGSPSGYAASMFYVISYSLMAAGGFGMIILLSRAGFEADRLTDFSGLNSRNAWYAFLMLILMLSMAGVPPFLGFWAKWAVLREAVAAGQVWLAAVAVFFAVIGLFYYLRVVRLVYFEAPEQTEEIRPSRDMNIVLSANALAILILGIYPTALMGLCIAALVP
jgi:NADH-quinone oxidoreductase subunit N